MDCVRARHVRGEEEAERLDGAFGGGITELFPVSVHVGGGEGAPRVLREDPRLAPIDQLPLGFQDVRHEVGGEEERVLLGRGACMVTHHNVDVVAVERCRFRVEVVFGPVGWRAGVGIVGEESARRRRQLNASQGYPLPAPAAWSPHRRCTTEKRRRMGGRGKRRRPRRLSPRASRRGPLHS